LADRYGALPPPVARLLRLAELRIQATARGVGRIEVREGCVRIFRGHAWSLPQGWTGRLIAAAPWIPVLTGFFLLAFIAIVSARMGTEIARNQFLLLVGALPAWVKGLTWLLLPYVLAMMLKDGVSPNRMTYELVLMCACDDARRYMIPSALLMNGQVMLLLVAVGSKVC
jgi:hypothetical protein